MEGEMAEIVVTYVNNAICWISAKAFTHFIQFRTLDIGS